MLIIAKLLNIIIMLTKGEMGDYRVNLPQDSLEEFLMEKKMFLVSFNLSYIKFISNLMHLINKILTFCRFK